MKKRWDILIFSVIFTALGAGGSWFAFSQGGEGGKKGGHEDEAAEAGLPDLPAATLKNLGVVVGEAKVTEFIKYRKIPAMIARTPSNEQPVFAPFGGRVLKLNVANGEVVKPGETLVTLVRSPIPRPRLLLTEEILKPANESIHTTVVDLRKADGEIAILKTELTRVEEFTGKIGNVTVPILPRQRAIDLKYQLLRATKTREQALLELNKHGFSDAQIKSIAVGGPIPTLGDDNWRLALKRNGLWPDAAETLFRAIPANLRKMAWVTATVGELSASGLNPPELAAWLSSDATAGVFFLEIGSLLQMGHTVSDVKRLHSLNAFSPIIDVCAPEGAVDWNVDVTMVRPGAQVETGEKLLTLLNPRVMYLKISPAGGEKSDVLRALAEKDKCVARPLVPGAGPILNFVQLTFATGDTMNTGGTLTFAEVSNTPMTLNKGLNGRTHRTWSLRAGLKYMLKIPTAKMKNVYVLPSGAVAVDGPHKVVFLKDGKTFRSVEVEILYQDEEFAVLPAGGTSEIFPGDPIVTSGAFSLGIALKSGESKPDAHAGHQH